MIAILINPFLSSNFTSDGISEVGDNKDIYMNMTNLNDIIVTIRRIYQMSL